MNLSASNIPCPVNYNQASRQRSQPAIPQIGTEEEPTLPPQMTSNVAFYVRSAIVDRAATDEQLSLLFDFASKQSAWTPTTCFFDWGSGLKKGSGLTAMVSAMRSPQRGFNVILVTNWSRISRNVDIFNEVRETASRCAVSLLSLAEIQAPSPPDPLDISGMISLFDSLATRRARSSRHRDK